MKKNKRVLQVIFALLFCFTGGSLPAQNIDSHLYALLSIHDPSSNTVVDGCMCLLDPTFNSGADYDDAMKLQNTGENLSFRCNGVLLAIDRRKNITADDTLFFNLTGTEYHDYQFDFLAAAVAQPYLTEYLCDNYLHTKKLIDLSASVSMVFNVNSDPASRAADRLMIVFSLQQDLLSVNFTAISASQNQDNSTLVNWHTENALNVRSYDAEHSADGRNFYSFSKVISRANNGGAADYNSSDSKPFPGTNYYRVKAINADGSTEYSPIVKTVPSTQQTISLYPNPVTGGEIHLHFENCDAQKYFVSIMDNNGRKIQEKCLSSSGKTFNTSFSTGALAEGLYRLKLTSDAGITTVLPFLVN